MRAQDARSSLLAVTLGLGVLVAGCYKGDEREKIPPPGYAGGACQGGMCGDGSTCDPQLNSCYYPEDPCYGFYCGGSDRGACMATEGGVPSCVCDFGWVNDLTPLYCCPDLTVGNMQIDPMCTPGAGLDPEEVGTASDGFDLEP